MSRRSTVPEKDPTFWAAVSALVSLYSTQIYAFVLSVGIAGVRVIYGGGTHRQAILEAILCGLVTLAIVPLLAHFGLPESMATFAGGACGFLGTEKLREISDRILSRKTGVK